MTASETPGTPLSQLELRNESGRVLRAVGRGQSFLPTNSGVPVGRLVPLDAAAHALQITRPARRVGGWAGLGIEPKAPAGSAADILDDIRADHA